MTAVHHGLDQIQLMCIHLRELGQEHAVNQMFPEHLRLVLVYDM